MYVCTKLKVPLKGKIFKNTTCHGEIRYNIQSINRHVSFELKKNHEYIQPELSAFRVLMLVSGSIMVPS